mmetsp:Transcript_49738/g.75136  ORF Transcript_49738/g.75136 Transcript_49738/m.75136 type:complete len:348 (-) Transcript_49738:211-1254(-)
MMRLPQKEWDSALRKGKDVNNKGILKFKYSTRDGLRLVDSIAKEILSASTGAASTSASSSASVQDDSAATSYSDLTQEGVVALMQAMATFNDQGGQLSKEDFAHYARRQIYSAMSRSLAQASRPIQLPRKAHETLKAARTLQESLRSSLSREPTVAEIAARLPRDITPEKLSLYMLVGRGTLSVESTVEIYDPSSEPTFADEDQYEATHHQTAHLHSGEDDIYNNLEEEEQWVNHDTIVAPLRDFIPDTTSPTPDDSALAEMIRHDVQDLLSTTLTPQEHEVIRMRFGLDYGRQDGLTLTEIGSRFGLSRQTIGHIEQTALHRLRTSYRSIMVEKYLDDDHADEVSV